MDEIKVFEDLKGQIVTAFEKAQNDEELTFTLSDGRRFKLYHEQDCCEQVYLAEVIGDLHDLLDSPLLLVEEAVNDRVEGEYGDGETWTFYKLATVWGYVTLRWVGSSNGYYSERVDFAEVTDA